MNGKELSVLIVLIENSKTYKFYSQNEIAELVHSKYLSKKLDRKSIGSALMHLEFTYAKDIERYFGYRLERGSSNKGIRVVKIDDNKTNK